ncbi:MAG: hypothetical protein JW928_00625 [Candidatus Aureabacteria bacterium]|nr:hypothetical protein [Candidatus Auribacterota bacterium]
MPQEISFAICHHHPSREGAGICVKCKKTFCSECLTKYDGINYCRGCLESVAHPKRKKRISLAFIKNIILLSLSLTIFFTSFYIAGYLLIVSKGRDKVQNEKT